MKPYYEDDSVTLYHGDCLDVLATLPDASVDAVVTDPPYDLTNRTPDVLGCEACGRTLGGRDGKPEACPRCGGELTRQRSAQGKGFMGKAWDGTGVAFRPAVWVECFRVLKPGGHLLAFGGTRTSHRLACAVEDAGFEIRDSIAWLYGSGFPKSLDVSKAIDKAAGAEREVVGSRPTAAGGTGYLSAADQTASGYRPSGREFVPVNEVAVTAPATPDAERWQGWGTALKPAHEPIVVARKPLVGTVAANVLTHGTGALNVDGCRVEGDTPQPFGSPRRSVGGILNTTDEPREQYVGNPAGRWPANVVLDESQAEVLDQQSGTQRDGVATNHNRTGEKPNTIYERGWGNLTEDQGYGGEGGASRFFYTAKADAGERVRIDGIAHPTVKPLALMRWLVRLVTPHGGTVLEPFAGSGTTVEACLLEGFKCIAIEREADYLPLVVQRINRRRDPVAAVKASGGLEGTLFEGLGA